MNKTYQYISANSAQLWRPTVPCQKWDSVELVKHPSLSATKLLVLEEEVEVELEEELLVLLEELLVDVEDVDVEDVDVEDVDVVLEELVDVEEVEEELVDVEDVEVELLEEVLVEVEVEEVEVELLEEVVVSGDPKLKPPKKTKTLSRERPVSCRSECIIYVIMVLLTLSFSQNTTFSSLK